MTKTGFEPVFHFTSRLKPKLSRVLIGLLNLVKTALGLDDQTVSSSDVQVAKSPLGARLEGEEAVIPNSSPG